MKHINLDKNTKGRDLLLADVNGCFKELTKLLEEVEFGKDDRLFLLGNSINKGLYSYDVVKFINQPNVYSLIGHAEVLMIMAMVEGHSATEREIYMQQWDGNGGEWRHNHTEEELNWVFNQVSKWPLSITIMGHKKYGLVHSESPFDDWRIFQKKPIDFSTLMRTTTGQTILQGERDGDIKQVDSIIAGHIQLARPPVNKGKCFYINHGIVIGKKAKIYQLDEF